MSASVVSGFLIARLRPGVEFVPEVSGLPPTVELCTLRLELARFVSSGLELLGGFHALNALCY